MQLQNQWILDLSAFTTVTQSSANVKRFTVSCDPLYKSMVCVNGINLATVESSQVFSVDASMPYSHVYVNDNCNATLTIRLKDSSTATTVSANYTPYSLQKRNDVYETEDNPNSLIGSYALLRTNPKLTGNIKLVVDSNENLFIDTFKVSKTLSEIKYRHVSVANTDYYGKNVASVFHDMNSTDLYHVEDECYNLFTTVKDYTKQYYTKYNVGVRTNTDNLYKENFAYLAPIALKRILPDFFIIFKVSDTSGIEEMSEVNKYKHFLQNSTIVKVFDMREGSELGKYIRSIEEKSRPYPADAFVAYDPNGINRFNGISIDKGVIAQCSENVIAFQDTTNQVSMNDYFSEGFERNRLVSKNIVNLEFMFDDPTSEIFSINTYFGLYVKLNSKNNDFHCVGYDSEKQEYVYDASIYDIENVNISVDSSYSDVIYGCSNPYGFQRLRIPLKTSDINDDYMMKPYKCIATSKLYKADNDLSYVSFELMKTLVVGEHIRFISTDKKEILEVIVSGSQTGFDEDGIGDVVLNHFNVGDHLMNEDYHTYRVCIHGENETSTEKEDIQNQIETIKKAFLKIGVYYDGDLSDGYNVSLNDFKYVIRTFSYNKMTITYVGSGISYFEHITNIFSSTSIDRDFDNNTMIFFGNVFVKPSFLRQGSSIDWKRSEHAYFYPFDFEVETERVVNIIQCVSISSTDYKGYTIDSSIFATKDYQYSLYRNTSEIYSNYDDVEIHNIILLDTSTNIGLNKEDNVIIRKSVEYNNGKYLVNITNPSTTNNTIDFFDIIPINCGVCSILPLRDFDFNVYDNVSALGYSQSASCIGEQGQYAGTDNYMAKALLNVSEDRFYNYIDKSDDGSKYRSTTVRKYPYGVFSGDFRNYTYNLIKENVTFSSLSLTAPHTCKWNSVSTNDLGEYIHLMYDFTNLTDSSSYFIPSDNEFNRHLGIQVNGDKGATFGIYPKYTTNDITSLSEEGVKARECILDENYRISDLLNDVYNTNINMSKVYNSGDNAVEFISGGVRFRLLSKDKNVINTDSYIDYSAVFMSTHKPSDENNAPVEVVIDEDRKEICVIWHQCRRSLVDTTVRNDSSASMIGSEWTSIFNRVSPIFTTTDIKNVDSRGGKLYIKNIGHYDYSYFGPDTVVMLTAISKYDPTYSNQNAAVIMGTVSERTTKNNLILENPIMYAPDGTSSSYKPKEATKYNLYHYIKSNMEISDMFAVNPLDASMRQPECIKNNQRTFSELREDVGNISIYLRTHNGSKYYLNTNNVASLTVSSPMEYKRFEKGSDKKYHTNTYGYVMPCYIEPASLDMLKFAYSDELGLGDELGINLNGLNIHIEDVNKMKQLWINKYTEDKNYCINGTCNKFSIDVLHNVSIFDGPWANARYKKYHSADDFNENSVNISGYTIGSEVNTYLSSKALCLKSYVDGTYYKELNIMSWKNTRIDSIKKTIRLCITDSIMNFISTMSGFPKSWNGYNYINDSYKNKFIKNYILNFIIINNNNVLTLYRGNEKTTGLTFSNISSNTIVNSLIRVPNFTNELVFENGKYYMYITVDEMYEYYANLNIKL